MYVDNKNVEIINELNYKIKKEIDEHKIIEKYRKYLKEYKIEGNIDYKEKYFEYKDYLDIANELEVVNNKLKRRKILTKKDIKAIKNAIDLWVAELDKWKWVLKVTFRYKSLEENKIFINKINEMYNYLVM